MLNSAEQGKYKTLAYEALKTAGVQLIMLKHPTKQFKKKKKKKPKHRINILCHFLTCTVLNFYVMSKTFACIVWVFFFYSDGKSVIYVNMFCNVTIVSLL